MKVMTIRITEIFIELYCLCANIVPRYTGIYMRPAETINQA
jgi:hypothetical protein